MGATVWADIEGRTPADPLPTDNSALHRQYEQLDALAAKLGVAPLSSFYDWSVMEGEALEELDGDDDATAEPPVPAWFEPGDALPTIVALREHLLAHPNAIPPSPRGGTTDRLLQELEVCRETLDRAASSGKKFRLLVVP